MTMEKDSPTISKSGIIGSILLIAAIILGVYYILAWNVPNNMQPIITLRSEGINIYISTDVKMREAWKVFRDNDIWTFTVEYKRFLYKVSAQKAMTMFRELCIELDPERHEITVNPGRCVSQLDNERGGNT